MLTILDAWFRPPFWTCLFSNLFSPSFPNMPCLFSTFHLEYFSVLSGFCLLQLTRTWLAEWTAAIAQIGELFLNSQLCVIQAIFVALHRYGFRSEMQHLALKKCLFQERPILALHRASHHQEHQSHQVSRRRPTYYSMNFCY